MHTYIHIYTNASLEVLFMKTVDRDAKCQDFPAEIAKGFILLLLLLLRIYIHTLIQFVPDTEHSPRKESLMSV